MKKVRVRFAPSPTGYLHIGGLRTALYNYIFAKKYNGDFILRVEDTDNTRFVENSIDYILDSLKWLNIMPNEGYGISDNSDEYIQSKRLKLYEPFINKLIEDGHAYYDFDSNINGVKYNYSTRMMMCNSLTLTPEKLNEMFVSNVPYVIRAKIEPNIVIEFNDEIRGNIKFNSSELDDKVLVKSNGIPTYHLAATLDDYLMNISHVFRGDEWLPSTPLHILLHKWFGNIEIPIYGHLSPVLGPDGKKKISKRDVYDNYFIYPLSYIKDGIKIKGYNELGFIPSAVVNTMSLLGWNPGSNIEVMNIDEIVSLFNTKKINNSGACFDYKKMIWFNKQYILKCTDTEFIEYIKPYTFNYDIKPHMFKDIKSMIDTKIEYLTESNFYLKPLFIEPNCKIDNQYKIFIEKYKEFINVLENIINYNHETIYENYNNYIKSNIDNKKMFMKMLRYSLTGEYVGVSIFHLMEFIGKDETIVRMKKYINYV